MRPGARQLRAHGVFVQRPCIAMRAQAIPDVVEGHRAGLEPVTPEGVHEGVSFVLPAVELDGQLDGAVGGLHDFEGIEIQRLEVAPDGGHRRLADTDGAHRG